VIVYAEDRLIHEIGTLLLEPGSDPETRVRVGLPDVAGVDVVVRGSA